MKFFSHSKISDNMHETPEGYLICVNVAIGRTGEMVYGPKETPIEPGEDGRVIISRDAEELFKPQTIASFEGKSFTITHPEEFVSPENWRELTCGVVQNVRQEGDDLVADILVTDKDAIAAIKAGTREVSCGYECSYAPDGPGRGKQIDIIGNHVALVDEGRAGTAYAINDHLNLNGAVKKMDKTFGETVKQWFAKFKTRDEAFTALDALTAEEKKAEAKDSEVSPASLTAIMEMMKAMEAKMEALVGEAKGEEKLPEPAAAADAEDNIVTADEGEEAPAEKTMEEKLAALEARVAQIESDIYEEDDKEESSEESEDAADDEDEEEPKKSKAKDAATSLIASRAEILSPGIAMSKDVKSKALKAAYATTDGKAAIESIHGGKPSFKEGAETDTLFAAAAELIKASRTASFAASKKTTDSVPAPKGFPTPNELNAINAAFWANKK